VGKRKYSYEVWGKTVNIASNMERLCEPGKVNISSVTYNLVKDKFDFENNRSVEISGNGKIEMFFVKKRNSKRELA
jgi:class 3 adenylate cyclase